MFHTTIGSVLLLPFSLSKIARYRNHNERKMSINMNIVGKVAFTYIECYK